jgi:competence protein ComEC
VWRPVHPLRVLDEARGSLFPWVPVLIGTGVGLWFLLPREPGIVFYRVLALVLCSLILLRRAYPSAAPLIVALICLLLGPLAAGLRVNLVAAPVLVFRYYGPIEGRVVEIDRSQADDLRITLDSVVLDRLAPDDTPLRVRVSLHGGDPDFRPEPGSTLILTGHLSPPPGPSEPAGFDFRRMAYFEQLGAVGYTTTPVLLLADPEPGAQQVNRMRTRLSDAIMARVPGQAGAFAAGAVTGDRSGITQETVAALRDSNLSHLLAISGMNMAFITGFVFAVVRYGLALVPPVALRINTKKVAAVVALAVAAFYLALSGSNVATERAFVMIAVMLVAVLADRRALSLRSVAIAAVLLLLVRPESLLGPGFQMSFAATTVLIAGFAMLDRASLGGRVPRWIMPVVTLVFSSVLAGLATAPLAAAHFNRFTDYGLIANLLTVPAMGVLIMPGAVIAVLLWPVGLEILGLWMMGLGSSWILLVAHWIAGWEGSVTGVATPGPFVLPVMALGTLWMILWQGRARLFGLLPVAAAIGVWAAGERPLALVSGDGAVIGLLGPEGRAMSSARGAGFAARSWLENDGDLVDQETAAARPGFSGGPGLRTFRLGLHDVALLKGKAAVGNLVIACTGHDLVIVSVKVADGPLGCRVMDVDDLARTGTLAIDVTRSGDLRITPTEVQSRLWSPRPRPVPDAALAVLGPTGQ